MFPELLMEKKLKTAFLLLPEAYFALKKILKYAPAVIPVPIPIPLRMPSHHHQHKETIVVHDTGKHGYGHGGGYGGGWR